MMAEGSGEAHASTRDTSAASLAPPSIHPGGAGLTTPAPPALRVPTRCPHCGVECHAPRTFDAHVRFYCRALYGRDPLSALNPHRALELDRDPCGLRQLPVAEVTT